MPQLSVIKPMLLLMALFVTGLPFAQPSGNRIQLSLLGFYPQAPKLAVVTGKTAPQTFYVINATTKDTVYKNALGAEKKSSNSSTVTRLADFSSLQKRGTFYIAVPGVGTSYPFQVTEQVYRPVAIAALKWFYFMRSDMALDAKYAGSWQRPAGHPDTAVLIHPSAADIHRPTGTILSTPVGWYDASDYNKYIVNSGINMGTLFSAYEDFKKYYDTLQTNIPESDDAIPDLLNKTIYNLRWLLTMQDPADGGVLSNLDYLLGRNATGSCFVTGNGSKSPMHPHHRLSVADGVVVPVPGLLSGGPNSGRQDGCTYAFTEPETAYADTDCSYASNEIAINWNAPMVYLANAVEALSRNFTKNEQNKSGKSNHRF